MGGGGGGGGEWGQGGGWRRAGRVGVRGDGGGGGEGGGLQIIPTHFMGTNFEVYILLLYKSTTCPGTILCTHPAKGDDAII